MKPELQDYLIKRYPSIFREYNNPVSSAPISRGIEVGDGWFHILNNLCSSIEEHANAVRRSNESNTVWLEKIQNKEKVSNWAQESYDAGRLTIEPIPDVTVIQIKEKFGTLRFSCTGFDEYVRGLIGMAYSMSETTCEECGKPGHLRSGGWIRVLCDEHANDKEESPIEIGSKIMVLSFGKNILIEILEITSPTEVVGKLVPLSEYGSPRKLNEGEKEQYFTAKHIVNDIFSYWNAEQFDI